MTIDEREVLSALMDGERVDAEMLSRVLEEPANRALLVDFARLRAMAREPVPGEDSASETARLKVVTSTTPMTTMWPRAAAAALLLASGLGAGIWVQRAMFREGPPAPSRVVQLQFDPTVRPFVPAVR
jgi:hypothetical protein